MPIPPLAIVLEILFSILLPGFVISALIGLLISRWKLSSVAILAGFLAANVAGVALPWFDWNHELGRLVLIMFLSLLTLVPVLRGKQLESNPWVRLASMGWIGLLATTLFYQDDIPASHIIGGAAVSMLLFAAINIGEQQLSATRMAGLAALSGLAIALVMIHAHTARLSDIGLMWMASTAGFMLVTFIKKVELRGLAGLAALLWPYLLYYGRQSTFSEVPWLSFVLIALAPAACLLALLNIGNKRVWLVSVVWAILLSLAVALAMMYETVAID